MNTTTTSPNASIAIKVTLVSNQEHRFIALPSASFAVLVHKVRSAFGIGAAAMSMHYIDDEDDRVSLSSDEELHCALSFANGRTLRLLVDGSSSTGAAPQQVQVQTTEEANSDKPTTIKAQQPEIEAIPSESKNPEAETDMGALFQALKQKLTNDGIDVCDKRCHRVLNKFGGDVDKAAAAIRQRHEKRTACRERHYHDPAKAHQREVCRNERLAARLARKQEKHNTTQTDANPEQAKNDRNEKNSEADALLVDSLVAHMAELGFQVRRGKCFGALRRCHGDVEQAKATLRQWCTNHHQHQDKKAEAEDEDGKPTRRHARRSAEVPAEYEPLLAQLEASSVFMGCEDDERRKRRNVRLLKRFDGDVAQVEAFLQAKKARIAERKARCADDHPKDRRHCRKAAKDASQSAC